MGKDKYSNKPSDNGSAQRDPQDRQTTKDNIMNQAKKEGLIKDTPKKGK
jgi:hypothetical protein